MVPLNLLPTKGCPNKSTLLIQTSKISSLVLTVSLYISSPVLLFFTRPIAVKYFNKERVRTNVESLIGKQAIIISEVDNLHGVGQATVNGQEWSARSVNVEVKIPVGAVVIIRAVEGVKLIVEERKEEN